MRIPTLAFRSWLVLLVVAAVLPLMLALGVALHVQGMQQDATRAFVLREKASSAAAVVSVRVELAAAALRSLGNLREAQEGDLPGLHRQATAMLGAQSLLGSATLADAGGLVLLRASDDVAGSIEPVRRPACELPSRAPELATPAWQPRTLRTAEEGEEGWQAELSMTLQQGALRGCRLMVTLSMQVFDAVLRARHWPEDWVASVVDGDGRIIARTGGAEGHVGELITAEARRAIAVGSDGEFDGRTVDGLPALGYVTSVPGVAGWHVVVGVPRRSIDREVRSASGPFVALTVVALVFACCAALVVARWMSSEVHDIADGAALDSPIAEVAGVSQLLRRSRDELEQAARRQHDVIRALEVENRRRVDTESRLKALQGRLFDAQEVERRRVARELHDELGQELALLQMRLKSIREPATAGPLGEAIAAVERLMDRARSLAMELRPHQLDDLGLPAALRALGRRAQEQSGVPVRVTVPGEALRLPHAVETALFRVAQGAVTNALRHAQPGAIAVELETGASEARLTVHDDGAGFDPRQVQGRHMGLQIMKERIEALGGGLTVRSAPGAGTAIEARVPIVVEEGP